MSARNGALHNWGRGGVFGAVPIVVLVAVLFRLILFVVFGVVGDLVKAFVVHQMIDVQDAVEVVYLVLQRLGQ